MTDPTTLALIHGEIDGELDAAGRAELARRMLADPKVRALREELQHLCRSLEAIPMVEPPQSLSNGIFAALPQSTVRRPFVRQWFVRGSSAPATGWRYAAAIACVLAVGTLVVTLKGNRPGASDVAGTFMKPGTRTAVVDTVTLGSGRLTGSATLVRDGTGLRVELDVSAAEPVDVRIASEGHTLEVKGLASQGPSGVRTEVVLPGFPLAGQPIELTFLMGGSEVGHATLQASR